MKKEKNGIDWRRILAWLIILIGIILLILTPLCSGCISGARCSEQDWISSCKVSSLIVSLILIVGGTFLIKLHNRNNRITD